MVFLVGCLPRFLFFSKEVVPSCNDCIQRKNVERNTVCNLSACCCQSACCCFQCLFSNAVNKVAVGVSKVFHVSHMSSKCIYPAHFNQRARCTKKCVGCTTKKRFTKVHHKLVTLNIWFLHKLSVSKNEPLTNPWLSGFNRDFAQSKLWCISITPYQANCN